MTALTLTLGYQAIVKSSWPLEASCYFCHFTLYSPYRRPARMVTSTGVTSTKPRLGSSILHTFLHALKATSQGQEGQGVRFRALPHGTVMLSGPRLVHSSIASSRHKFGPKASAHQPLMSFLHKTYDSTAAPGPQLAPRGGVRSSVYNVFTRECPLACLRCRIAYTFQAARSWPNRPLGRVFYAFRKRWAKVAKRRARPWRGRNYNLSC